MNKLTALLALALLAAGCGDDLAPPVQLSGHAYNYIGTPGDEGFNGDGLHRLDTRLYWTMDMLFHSDGTQYFIDWNNHIVRKLLPDDTVETVVGSIDPILPGDGEPTGLEYTEDGAPGRSIRLNHPTTFAEQDDGTILLMSWHNHKLRSIDPETGNTRILCGGGAGFRGDGGPASEALLKQPTGLTIYLRTIYIGDQQNFRIRTIDEDGIIETIAGNGEGNLTGEPGGENIPALESPIDWEAGSNPEPSGGLVRKGNTLYLAETLRHRIRAIDLTTGLIRTVAGTGEPGYSGDFGPALEAQLNNPRELELGPEGDLYVADTDNNTIRAINLESGEIRTVVGTGTLGLDDEDGLLATSTQLKRPFGLEFDPEGNLYVMDTINSRVLKVPPMKTLTAIALAFIVSLTAACSGDDPCVAGPGEMCTIAGSGENGYTGDDGPALTARMSLPMDTLAMDDGSLLILDWNNHRLRKVTPEGDMLHVAGRGELGGTLDDPALSDFNHPTGMLLDPDGVTLYIAAWHNSKVRSVNLDTLILSEECGDGRRAYFGDGGPAADATLDLPTSMVFDPAGNLVIMDQANQVIRRVDENGIIDRIAGVCVTQRPGGCGDLPLEACPDGSGKLSCDPTACGEPCDVAYGGDGGSALDMRMAQPFGQSALPGGRMVYDPDGNLLFADASNNLIRKIDTDGIVTTIAGTPPIDGQVQAGYDGDGGPATSALLNNPVDLALHDDGTIYFSDVNNHCIRAIDTSGTIRSVAGVCGTPSPPGDLGQSDGAADTVLLKLPFGLEISGDNMYIADMGNNVIRHVVLP